MEIFFGILVFFFGTLIGSFLNVCIYRIPMEESISFPPSHCGNCGNFLRAKDLVPIFSYLFLKGKCRYCGEGVSKQYPIVEFLTGIIFFVIYLNYGITLEFFKFIFLGSMLIVIGIIDLKTQYIYTNTIVLGLVSSILFVITEGYIIKDYSIVSDHLIGALLTAGILAIIVIITEAMGWGDVELMFVIGLFIGMKLSVLTLFLSIVLGGLAAIFLLATKIKNRGDSMAFGPFISGAAIISILYGNEIINWYVSTFFI